MEIKYEAVFGDQSLFDGFMDDCEFTDGNYGFKVANACIAYCERYNQKFGWSPIRCAKQIDVIGMRRIIRTPTWTVADQKAGKLPEVGAKCRQGHKEETVIAVTENFVVTECLDGAVCATRKCEFMASYNPVETSEEKAQREEDEFVASVIDLASENQLMSCGFKDGVIAAYRKLKGGE